MGAKQSISRDSHGKETERNYTERRPDGKAETRHYSPRGLDYRGKTVNDKDGKATDYTSGGRKR